MQLVGNGLEAPPSFFEGEENAGSAAAWAEDQEPANLVLVPERPLERTVGLARGGFLAVTGQADRAVVVEGRDCVVGATRGPIGVAWLRRFERRGTKWVAGARVELPGVLDRVAKLPDGALLLGFESNSLVLRVAPDGTLSSGDCTRDEISEVPILDIVQAFLNDAGVARRLVTRGAPLPLHVSFERESGVTSSLTFQGQPVILERDEASVDAGRTLHVVRLMRDRQDLKLDSTGGPSRSVVLQVRYLALGLDDGFRFSLGLDGWRVQPDGGPTGDTGHPAPPAGVNAPTPALLDRDWALRNHKALAMPPRDLRAPPAGVTRTASGVVSKIIKRSKRGAATPAANAVVTIRYNGWTEDGWLFDSSLLRRDASRVPLQLLVPGLAGGIGLMVQGETRRFWIPERLAHPHAASFDVPRGALVVDVELVGIEGR